MLSGSRNFTRYNGTSLHLSLFVRGRVALQGGSSLDTACTRCSLDMRCYPTPTQTLRFPPDSTTPLAKRPKPERG